jgi:hypothetical protein
MIARILASIPYIAYVEGRDVAETIRQVPLGYYGINTDHVQYEVSSHDPIKHINIVKIRTVKGGTKAFNT